MPNFGATQRDNAQIKLFQQVSLNVVALTDHLATGKISLYVAEMVIHDRPRSSNRSAVYIEISAEKPFIT